GASSRTIPIMSSSDMGAPRSKGDVPAAGRPRLPARRPLVDQRTDRLTIDDGPDVALPQQVEHDNGQLVVHAECDRGRVHGLEATVENFEVADLVEPCGRRISPGVARV